VSEEQIVHFFKRIDILGSEHKPLFGEMNVNQMICHCTDFFRLANGSKKAFEYGVVDPKSINSLAKSNKPIPTPKGFGQVEGDGTLPTNLENDKKILKEHILEFSKLPIFHLDHHLKQFNV